MLECWGLSITPLFQYSSTPAKGKGKSGSLDTKTQFMPVYSILIIPGFLTDSIAGFMLLITGKNGEVKKGKDKRTFVQSMHRSYVSWLYEKSVFS